MKAADRTLLEWLGEEAVAAVLRHSLDRASLVRLANARRVAIPGMRNQSLSADRLAGALAGKFAREEASRRILLSALDTANRNLLEEWRRLSEEEIRGRLGDDRLSPAAAARILYALSRERRDGIGPEEARVLFGRCRPQARREEPAAPIEPAGQQERDDLAARLASAQEALDRSGRKERQIQQELAQKKFELNNLKLQAARARHEQERLEKDLRAALEKIEDSAGRRKSGAIAEEAASRLAQIHEQGRKVAATLEKMAERLGREDKAVEKIVTAVRSVDALRRETGELRKVLQERGKGDSLALADMAQRLSDLREDVAALRASPKRPSPVRATRPREGIERAGLFVDVQNVFYGARLQNARLDFEELIQTVSRGRRMIRATAYVVESREIDQSGFIALLQQKGYEVKRKPLKVRADGSQKGDWDLEIALDALDICEALDVLVLVTGDGDFTSLVQRVKARGVQVEVYSFPRNTAKELREAATRFIPIDRRLLIKLPKDVPAREAEEEPLPQPPREPSHA